MSDATQGSSKERLASLRKRFDESHRDWRMGHTEELFSIAEAMAASSPEPNACCMDFDNCQKACATLTTTLRRKLRAVHEPGSE